MTAGEEKILNKMVTEMAVLNTNFNNHAENDAKHKEYVKEKLEKVTQKFDKIDNIDIAVNGTDVEKHEDGLVAKVNSHIGNYHPKNEESWGFQTYFKNHLKHFAVFIILIIFALSLLGYNIDSIAKATLKSFGVKIELPVKEK